MKARDSSWSTRIKRIILLLLGVGGASASLFPNLLAWAISDCALSVANDPEKKKESQTNLILILFQSHLLSFAWISSNTTSPRLFFFLILDLPFPTQPKSIPFLRKEKIRSIITRLKKKDPNQSSSQGSYHSLLGACITQRIALATISDLVCLRYLSHCRFLFLFFPRITINE